MMKRNNYIALCLKSLAFLVVSLVLSACQSGGFDGREVFVSDYLDRAASPDVRPYFAVLNKDLSLEQREALEFLYAYMALPDVVDYSGDFYLMNVDYALKARKEMPWGVSVPDREFLHFVLPVRVNNEDLDESRKVFYEELKDRVKNLSMYDAVLEVNHWCHEKVTYTPSDSRTSSPLATIRTAHGRCGEESTFTVAALRAVGIPARQVYTPRWAHTDDNHAWVEAWVDGQWYFLGACEPEPVLNLGWFNAPASRGLLMHTRVYGNYQGPEEVVGRNACYTEINVTPNYAPTATTHFQVVDVDGNPVQTTVEFKIYNYAEFYTAVRKESDEEGRTFLTTGCGDMMAWASKDGMYGFSKFTVGKDSLVNIVLNKTTGYLAQLDVDMIPPAERNTAPQLTEEQQAYKVHRLAYEDSIRNAYVASFPTPQETAMLADSLGVNSESLIELVKQSRGNYSTIAEFLRYTPEEQRKMAMLLLGAISEKDRRDITLKTLEDHLMNTPEKLSYLSTSEYVKYVMNPRVSNELLTPYKSFFSNLISTDDCSNYRSNPEIWATWCKEHIRIDQKWNPRQFCMSPKGVWNLRLTDTHSRDIFFVASARSMGIPSRIDEVTGKTQYMNNQHEWCDVQWEAEEGICVTEQGKLYAKYQPTDLLENPKYYSHFSISKIEDGQLVLQNYPEDATCESLLMQGIHVDAGDYLIVSGTRMADGSVLSHLEFLHVPAGGETRFTLIQREDKDELQVIGSFNSENLYHDLSTQQNKSILSTTGRGYYIIALVEPNCEPTNHFLRDMMPYKSEFETWGQKILLLFENAEEASRFKTDEFPQLPATIVCGTDIHNTIQDEIFSAFPTISMKTPIILVADTFNRIVFISHGYSIGLGEQLVKVIKQLD